MIDRLIANGCSYMYSYEIGNGPADLAKRLGISTAHSLALAGSCNSRIIRTTLKDSYITNQPTLYIVGLSFLHRSEIPVGHDHEFEGRWLSSQIEFSSEKIDDYFWSYSDSKQVMECFSKLIPYAVKDHLEQLMFSVLAMISDLTQRGHQVVVFRQPPDAYVDLNLLDDDRFKFLKNCVNIVDGLRWGNLEFLAGKDIQYPPEDLHLPKNIRHPRPGEHTHLNEFLVEYIAKHNLL